MKYGLWAVLLSISMSAAYAGDFETIEEKIFLQKSLQELWNIGTNSTGLSGEYQNAMVLFRIGSMTTNPAYIAQATRVLEKLDNSSKNVFIKTYLGLFYTMQARGGLDLGMLDKGLKTLNFAVTLWPTHYLPRFFRGMLLLFIPDLTGKNEERGVSDMQVVLNQLPTLNRSDEYKGFVYFFWAIYQGEKKKNYTEALKYMQYAQPLVSDSKLKESINKKLTEYKAKAK